MPPPPAHIHLTAGGAPRRLPARCRPRGEALPQSGCGAVAATWSRAGREVSAAGQRLHLAGGGGGPGRGCGTLGPGLLGCGLPFLSLVPLSVSVVAGSDGGERNKGEPGDLPKSERANKKMQGRCGLASLLSGADGWCCPTRSPRCPPVPRAGLLLAVGFGVPQRETKRSAAAEAV